MRESDLFTPVKNLFCGMGYKVNAEVLDCDITALKGDELIIIELKRTLSVTLLSQALERQKTGAKVYIAVPKPKKYSPRKFRDTLYVIKKLELGLIFVTLKDESCSFAEIIHNPEQFKPVRKNKKERTKIIEEINGRAIDNNIGGVTHRKIATAFTEKNIYAACVIERYGTSSPKIIKEITGNDCGGLLRADYYGWFRKIEKGIYTITDKCRQDLKDYPELTEYYRKKLRLISTIN
ncbi:MAG: hypothetical protein J1G06_06070 [Oscillospiraceae bacterium]|nr:hypothetical protein [Oscillospiraceae bacterium]